MPSLPARLHMHASEMQLERELHGARSADLVKAGEATELAAFRVGGLTEQKFSIRKLVVNVAKDGVIKDVVSLSAELQADSFVEGEVAPQCKISLHGIESSCG